MNDLFVHLPGPDHDQVLLDDMHSLTYNPTWPTATQSLRNSLKPIHLHVYDTPLLDREIRLLMLKIGNGDDAIHCTLDNRSLDNMPEGTKYFALSYVWGNPDETTTILCDGQLLSITKNLHSFLWQIREESEWDPDSTEYLSPMRSRFGYCFRGRV